MIVLGSAMAAAQAVEAPKVTSDALELDVGGSVQTQFNTTSVDADEPPSQVVLRRVRLSFDAWVSEVISGRIQLGINGDRLFLGDAHARLSLSPATQVVIGRAFRPFSRVEQTGSIRALPIERGAELRGRELVEHSDLVRELAYSGRDVGVQLVGVEAGLPLGAAYRVGVFRGPVHGVVGSRDSYQFAGRGTIRLTNLIGLGVGWSSRHFHDPSQAEGADLRRGHAFEMDAEVGAPSPGVRLLGEVAFGDSDPFQGKRFFGTQAWAGYRTGAVSRTVSGLEPLFRASFGDPGGEVSLGEGTVVLTPGINLYFGGLNRLMLNFDVFLPREKIVETSLKAMFQMAF